MPTSEDVLMYSDSGEFLSLALGLTLNDVVFVAIDLDDGVAGVIPYDKMEEFFRANHPTSLSVSNRNTRFFHKMRIFVHK